MVLKIFRRLAGRPLYYLFILPVVFLAGCVSFPKAYHLDPALTQQMRTIDPEEIHRRWGAYSHMIGKHWIANFNGDMVTLITMQWVVQGASAQHTEWSCEPSGCYLRERLVQYNPEAKTLDFMLKIDSPRNYRKIKSEDVLANGEVTGWMTSKTWRYDLAAGTMHFGDVQLNPTTESQYRESLNQLIEASKATRQRKAEESIAFWNNLASGMAAVTQATAQVARETGAERARSEAQLQDTLRRSAALARERERIAQSETEVKAQVAAREVERQNRLAEQERHAQFNAQQQKRQFAAPTQASSNVSASNGVRAGNPPGAKASSSERGANLIATPEAIMVCSKPSGPNGSFECRSPTDVTYGSQKDGKGYRTPEERVMSSDACTSPRRLVSTTHLVWGCGFGATNNGNSLDRSAGVNVKGRNTYYCHDKETSCRKTTP